MEDFSELRKHYLNHIYDMTDVAVQMLQAMSRLSSVTSPVPKEIASERYLRSKFEEENEHLIPEGWDIQEDSLFLDALHIVSASKPFVFRPSFLLWVLEELDAEQTPQLEKLVRKLENFCVSELLETSIPENLHLTDFEQVMLINGLREHAESFKEAIRDVHTRIHYTDKVIIKLPEPINKRVANHLNLYRDGFTDTYSGHELTTGVPFFTMKGMYPIIGNDLAKQAVADYEAIRNLSRPLENEPPACKTVGSHQSNRITL